jgi:nitrous oxidase accessory protein
LLLLALAIVSPLWSVTLEQLQTELDASVQGQVVTMPAGRYQGVLVIRHAVVLRAQAGAKLIHPAGTSGATLSIQSSDVSVEGLEIEGTGEGFRRDHTAVWVSGSRIKLKGLRILNAWSGVWLDQCDTVSITELGVMGLPGFAFWERGEGVRITNGTNLRLQNLQLTSVGDGVYAEHSADLHIEDCRVQDARYGLHSMFSSRGDASHLQTSQTVAGLMLMESSQWTIRSSQFVDGYRTGSAGVREIRTKNVSVLNSVIARQASGVELLDVRNGDFRGNQVIENGVAWTWGGDSSGTVIRDNSHRGNLMDFAGQEPSEKSLFTIDAHNHGAKLNLAPTASGAPTVTPTALHIRPEFDGNYWDGWTGTDLDQDGIGDTPYRFDYDTAVRAATRPWAGVFLGSPWSQWSRTVPGGVVIDEHPATRALP